MIPEELLDLIFTYLDSDSIKNASQVSRLWRNTLDKGKFWKWSKLRVNLAIHPEQKEMLIHSTKLAVVPRIVIAELDKPLVESVLQAITDGATPRLEELHITLRVDNGHWDNAVDIDPDLLSQAATKVETCTIASGYHRQLETILIAIIQSQELPLKRLNLQYPPDDPVSPYVLAAAAVKLEGLFLGCCTPTQAEELLLRLAKTEDSKLILFEINSWDGETNESGQFDISHLSPEILSRALVKLDLDTLNLSNRSLLAWFKFSPEQINSLFIKIRDSHLNMTEFCCDLSQVPPQLMASAFSRLKSVELFADNHVSTQQLAAIFTMLASQEIGGSKLKTLGIYGDFDLASISQEVLVEATRRLENLYLDGVALNADQINAILTAVTEKKVGMLKFINIEIYIEDIVGTVSLLENAKQVKDLLDIKIFF